MIVINRTDTTPFYRQIYRQIVEDIESGVYRTDERLPSIRSFATELEVSRNTVEQAYLLLTEEGFIRARQGSGYYVNAVEPPCKPPAAADDGDMERLRRAFPPRDARPPRFDFSFQDVEEGAFPFYRWARISREVLLDPGREGFCRTGDPRGLPELRSHISQHLAKEHGMHADPDLVAIVADTRAAVTSALGLFERKSTIVHLEDPGRVPVRMGVQDSGFAMRPLTAFPAFDWESLGGAGTAPGKTHVLCTAPAGAFPVGRALGRRERERLLRWAEGTGSYIIEDTYGQAFPLNGPRVPSLGSLDRHGRVIVAGSFAESLSPSVGVAYLVLPPALMMRWLERETAAGPAPAWHVQATLARFMEAGLWDGHLRRMQTAARKKHHAMLEAARKHLGGLAGPGGHMHRDYGLHVPLAAGSPQNRDAMIRRAQEHGIRIYSDADCWMRAPKAGAFALLGYAGIPIGDIEPGIRALARALREDAGE